MCGLIVDNEEIIREILYELLEDESEPIAMAGSFAEAVRLLLSHQYDWVLLDQNLGDGYGLDLVPRIPNENWPASILMFTSEGDDAEFVAGANKAGVHVVFTKPHGLLDAVDYIIGKRKAGYDYV